jgi:phage-related protein
MTHRLRVGRRGERHLSSLWVCIAHTQALYYRSERGSEPVADFIAALPIRHAAKIHAAIEEHLNDKAPDAPPPPFPASSQIRGELRELRVRFANLRYRVLYQRSANLVLLLHAFEKTTGSVPPSEIAIAERRLSEFQATDGCQATSSAAGRGRRFPMNTDTLETYLI